MSENKRKQQAEQTRLMIFNAALRLLQKQDFDSITVRDIVREANVSIGSFYNYYKTKMDVYYETYQISDVYFETQVKPALRQRSAAGRIRQFFREYAHYNAEISGPELTAVLYNAENHYFRRETVTGIVPILVSLAEYGIKRGEFTDEHSAEEIADYLMVCARGIVYDWCIRDNSFDLSERFDELVPLLLSPFLTK